MPRPRRTALPPFLVSSLLLVFSASGLMAGGLTFKLVGHPLVVKRATTPTAPSSLAWQPSPTPTASSSALINEPFTLSIELQPGQVRPGQILSVTVVARSNQTHAPIAGLRCYLDDPTDGSTPLLAKWPGPVVTNANGRAHWAITVPRMAPGTYEIGYGATGSLSNWYHGQETVLVTG